MEFVMYFIQIKLKMILTKINCTNTKLSISFYICHKKKSTQTSIVTTSNMNQKPDSKIIFEPIINKPIIYKPISSKPFSSITSKKITKPTNNPLKTTQIQINRNNAIKIKQFSQESKYNHNSHDDKQTK